MSMTPADPGPRKFKLESHRGRDKRTARDFARQDARTASFRLPGEIVIDLPELPIGDPVDIPPRDSAERLLWDIFTGTD